MKGWAQTAYRLERVILWEEHIQQCPPPVPQDQIGCAPMLQDIGCLNPKLHVLHIGDELIILSIIIFQLDF